MKNKSENFYVNGVYIASFWYDFAKEKLLLYTVDGHLEAEIAMGNKQYNQLYKENPNPSGEGSVWNKLVELFGDISTPSDDLKCPLGGSNTIDCIDCAYSPNYHFVDGECVERMKTLENNKKKNMAYWDVIDETCYEAVRGVAASSQTEIDEDELEDAVTEIGAEIRDIIIEKLKAIGGDFPFVDENY